MSAGIAAVLSASVWVIADQRPSLFVFVPSLVRARALVLLLEHSLPGVDVVAFGRFADFLSAVRRSHPSAALSLPDALEAVGLSPSLRGVGVTGQAEQYVVLTLRSDLELDHLGDSLIGMVDIVGRGALPKLVQRLLGLKAVPRVRRVLKVADLLPLLNLELADAVVVPERLVEDLTKSSRQQLFLLRPKTAQLGRVSLAFPAGNVPLIREGLQRLSAAALNALGVSGWEGGS